LSSKGNSGDALFPLSFLGQIVFSFMAHAGTQFLGPYSKTIVLRSTL